MKIDFHCHSHFSDGHHSPQFLLQRAAKNQLTHLAITDHDCITDLSKLEIPAGLILVPGIEISCNWNKHEIHLVGLQIEDSHPELNAFINGQQQARTERVSSISEKLEKLGISGLLEFMAAKPCLSWTRSHVAEFLVSEGHSKTFHKAFKKFLKPSGSVYVAAQWPALNEAISIIKQAGGIAVLAHPSRYNLTNTKLLSLINDFILAEGEAIEVSFGGIDPIRSRALCDIALQRNLFVSAGSDFHTTDRQWTDLGKFPAIESRAIKNAIWNHSRWHSIDQ
ncbi:MAG: phosphatase [Gammaproteobacteria bacterium]|nr:phosphatase [Gammaproteobacteria bacterium]